MHTAIYFLPFFCDSVWKNIVFFSTRALRRAAVCIVMTHNATRRDAKQRFVCSCSNIECVLTYRSTNTDHYSIAHRNLEMYVYTLERTTLALGATIRNWWFVRRSVHTSQSSHVSNFFTHYPELHVGMFFKKEKKMGFLYYLHCV